MLLRVLHSAFPVRSGERRLTALLLLHNLFAVGAFTAGRAVRDALYLAHADRAHLPWMYVASAVAVAGVGLLYAPRAARVRRDRMAVGGAVLFGGLYLLAWVAQRAQAPFVYPLLYVYVEVMGALTLVQFWTLANDLFHAREAKRLYGFIGSGGMIANIVVGLLTAQVAKGFGASAILILCAGLLLGTAGAALFAGRLGRQRMVARAVAPARTAVPGRKKPEPANRVWSSPHLRMVAALTGLTFLTTSIVDFQFKVIAGNHFAVDGLAAFFGYFYSVVGVLALGLQLFGTGRILQRAGVVGALSLLPLALGSGSLVLAVLPSLWIAAAAKGSDNLFRYSINDASTQILYLPLSPQARASAKAFIDSVVKPASIGLAGLSLLGYRAVFGPDPWRLAWVAVGLCAAWLSVVLALRSRYVKTLQENLRRRRLDWASARHKVQGGEAVCVLIRALEGGDPREVLHALELSSQVEDAALAGKVAVLLDHPLPAIRIAALEHFRRREAVPFASAILGRFGDDAPAVRAAAVETFCALGRERAVRQVKPCLDDADPAVRAAAIAGLIRYGGLDGVVMAAEALKGLIAHPEPVMRRHAARVLGAVGVSHFGEKLLALMNDPALPVRREAIASAGRLRSPELVVPLIYRTRSPQTAREAVEALAHFGPSIVPLLGKVLGNPDEVPPLRSAAALVLGRVGTPEAVALLCRALGEPDEVVRTRVYRALAKAARPSQPLVRAAVDKPALLAAVDRELLRAWDALAAQQALGLEGGVTASTPRSGPLSSAALLCSALSEKAEACERRIFILLAVLYPEAEMEGIHASIRDALAEDAPRRRATAVELLDNLLERDLQRKLLPLLEELPRAEKLTLAAAAMSVRQADPRQTVAALLRDENAWVRACAVYFASTAPGAVDGDALAGRLEEACDDPSDVVREIARLQRLRGSRPAA